jgi:GTPase
MSNIPRVVIVGRTNVGKSTLFNRLSVDVKSLTLDYEGVTRDFIKDTVCWKDRCFELIDTGGISIHRMHDELMEEAQQRARSVLEKADLVVFVCDGTIGVINEDHAIATMLHKIGKPVLLAVNKIDTKLAQEQLYEFAKLGFKVILPISAQHGTGIGDLLDTIDTLLPREIKKQEEIEPLCKVVILGKPNVGKSSLLNLLLKEERAIVAAIPGTTREAITEQIKFFKEDIQITDTPGIRKKRSVTENLESMMVKSSLRAIDKAHIVLLMVDGSEATIADQELKLAFYTFEEHYKALILLVNKQDLVDERIQEEFKFQTSVYDYFLKKIARLDISCKTGKNVGKIIPLVNEVWKRYSQWLPEDDLTLFFRQALEKKPLYHSQNLLQVYKVGQVKTAPITLSMKVNVPGWFGPSQLKYFENLLREKFDLKGVPLKFVLRSRQ